MGFLQVLLALLYGGFFFSLIYGIVTYVMMKYKGSKPFKEEDRSILKEHFVSIMNSSEEGQLLETSMRAKQHLPRYKKQFEYAALEKKDPSFSSNLLKKADSTRKWWLISFILYYVINLPFLIAPFSVKGETVNAAILLTSNLVMIFAMYHCAYKKRGWRLLLSMIFFMAIYIFEVGYILVHEYANLSTEFPEADLSKLMLPLALFSFFLFFYLIESMLLCRVNWKLEPFMRFLNIKKYFFSEKEEQSN